VTLVQVQVDHGIVEVVLNRPEKRNALSWDMLRELLAAAKAIGDLPGLRCVVLRGSGPVFCAGADLQDFAGIRDDVERAAWIRLGGEAFSRIGSLPAPVIAAVHGAAIGGGLELALQADLRIVESDTRLQLPEVPMGWLPEWGGLALLSTLVARDRALHLLISGRMLNGAEAVKIGLATLTAPNARDAADELAATIGSLKCEVRQVLLSSTRSPSSPGTEQALRAGPAHG
jgi:enoyl-CoA hydratase/carnithine racemase